MTTLKNMAIQARENAYAPYSKFKVGAALKTKNGDIFIGCNVENAAYPEGTCAEAGAIAAMIVAGQEYITDIHVVADSPRPVSPCGGCRQKIAEFSDSKTKITMSNLDGLKKTMLLHEILPGAFDATDMEE